MEGITPQELNELGVTKDNLMALIAEGKAASANRTSLENFGESMKTALTDAVSAMSKVASEERANREASAYESIDANLVDTFKKLDSSDPRREEIKRLISASAGEAYAELALEGSEYEKTLLRPVGKYTKNREEIEEFHKAHDILQLTAAALGGISKADTANALPNVDKKIFARAKALLTQQEKALPGMKAINDALDSTTAGDGLEFVPSLLSSTMLEDVWLSLQIEGLFQRINMPSATFKLPIRTGRSRAYRVAQATTNSQFFSNLFTAHSMDTSDVTFTADKLGVLNFISDELEEDSIVPVMNMVRGDVLYGLADAIEDTALNGSTSATDLDNAGSAGDRLWNWDGTGSNTSGLQVQNGTNDARYAWDGIRKGIGSSQKINGATLSLDSIRAARKTMGKYGMNPSELALIISFETMISILSFPELLTIDKYGANATVLTGEIGRLDGIRVIVSPRVYTTLNASGVFDNTTMTKTALYLVNTRGFAFGDRRMIRVESDRNGLAGQNAIFATMRLDFQKVFASSEPLASTIYNVTP